jgi:hypothetical protein
MSAPLDDLLSFLTYYFDRQERQGLLPLTVSVGGTVVTGMLISEDEYFSRVGTKFSREMAGPTVEGQESLDRFFSSWPDRRVGEADPQAKFAHVHLADAQVILSGGGMLPPVLWRCRTDAIDGYCFERIMPGPPPAR